jgi:uncharacterized protein YraI
MKFKMTINFTKMLAFLMLVGCIVAAMYLNSETPITVGLPIVGAIIAGRDYQDRKTSTKTPYHADIT